MAGDTAHDDMMERAIAVVGWNPPGNISLQAGDVQGRHILPLRCLLPESAPLVEALESEPVRDAFQRYHEDNVRAVQEQNVYRRWTMYVVVPLVVALLVSVGALLVPSHEVARFIAALPGIDAESRDRIEVVWLQAVPWLVYGGVVLTALLVKWLKPGDRYQAWQKARGQAEAMRRELFSRLLHAQPAALAAGGSAEERSWALLLKLEYFRRWQVELQEAYFLKRSNGHRKKVTQSAMLGSAYAAVFVVLGIVLLLSAVGAGDEQGPSVPQFLAGVRSELSSMTLSLEAARGDYWLVLAGLLAAGAFTHLYLQTVLGASVRNAPRFENMAANFRDLKDRLTVVRAAAARGDEQAVRDFVNDVHAVMSLELNDWVRLADLDMGRDQGSFASQRSGAAADQRTS